MQLNYLAFALVMLFGCNSCRNSSKTETNTKQPLLIHLLHQAVSDAIVQDGFPPSVAARIYAYAHIAAYEALAGADTLPSFQNKLKDFKGITQATGVYPRAVMVAAFCTMAKDLVYHDVIIDSALAQCQIILKNEADEAMLQKSYAAGDSLAAQILKWAAADNYGYTRNLPRFTPTRQIGHWVPTPPTFTDALEPYCCLIRPFIIDTSITMPDPPIYTTDKNSAIYKEALAVMDFQQNIDTLKRDLVLYWDCNPQRTYVKGHVMYRERQISPGGHWMAIAGQICRNKNYSESKAAEVYAITGITLNDAFIICWKEKYRCDYLRPETYINDNIDKAWHPYLESPPFPEYPSGHACISKASSIVLEYYFGTNCRFIDSAEIPFGMKARAFASLSDAAQEAAQSRVDGGIHFPSGRDFGIKLGEQTGKLVLEKMKK